MHTIWQKLAFILSTQFICLILLSPAEATDYSIHPNVLQARDLARETSDFLKNFDLEPKEKSHRILEILKRLDAIKFAEGQDPEQIENLKRAVTVFTWLGGFVSLLPTTFGAILLTTTGNLFAIPFITVGVLPPIIYFTYGEMRKLTAERLANFFGVLGLNERIEQEFWTTLWTAIRPLRYSIPQYGSEYRKTLESWAWNERQYSLDEIKSEKRKLLAQISQLKLLKLGDDITIRRLEYAEQILTKKQSSVRLLLSNEAQKAEFELIQAGKKSIGELLNSPANKPKLLPDPKAFVVIPLALDEISNAVLQNLSQKYEMPIQINDFLLYAINKLNSKLVIRFDPKKYKTQANEFMPGQLEIDLELSIMDREGKIKPAFIIPFEILTHSDSPRSALLQDNWFDELTKVLANRSLIQEFESKHGAPKVLPATGTDCAQAIIQASP